MDRNCGWLKNISVQSLTCNKQGDDALPLVSCSSEAQKEDGLEITRPFIELLMVQGCVKTWDHDDHYLHSKNTQKHPLSKRQQTVLISILMNIKDENRIKVHNTTNPKCCCAENNRFCSSYLGQTVVCCQKGYRRGTIFILLFFLSKLQMDHF